MDYEKAYKEALEKIREGLQPLPDGAKISGVTRAFLEEVFPELKESEDEKIRKAILEFVRQSSEILDKQNQNNMIAWLEKQKEYVSPQMVADAYLRGCNDTESKLFEKQGGHKPELNDEDICKELQTYLRGKLMFCMIKEEQVNIKKYISWLEKQGKETSMVVWHSVSEAPNEMEELLCEWESDDATWHDVAFYHADTKTFWNGERQVIDVTRWCYVDELVEKQGEKKPTWSEEDYSKVQRICKYLKEAKKYYADITEVRECMDWLKSLKERVQPKPKEWSEEDEEILKNLIDYFSLDDGLRLPTEETIDWLKSLKEKLI